VLVDKCLIGQYRTTVAGLLMCPSLLVKEVGTLGVAVAAVVCNDVCSLEVAVSDVVVEGSLTWWLGGSCDVVAAANVVGVAEKGGAPSCSC